MWYKIIFLLKVNNFLYTWVTMVIYSYFIHWFAALQFLCCIIINWVLMQQHQKWLWCIIWDMLCYIVYGNIRDHNIFILLGMATLGTDQVFLQMFDNPHCYLIIQILYKWLRLGILSFFCPYVEVIVISRI
jgi:hypothetical protein